MCGLREYSFQRAAFSEMKKKGIALRTSETIQTGSDEHTRVDIFPTDIMSDN